MKDNLMNTWESLKQQLLEKSEKSLQTIKSYLQDIKLPFKGDK